MQMFEEWLLIKRPLETGTSREAFNPWYKLIAMNVQELSPLLVSLFSYKWTYNFIVFASKCVDFLEPIINEIMNLKK
jgi:hypothetical protein